MTSSRCGKDGRAPSFVVVRAAAAFAKGPASASERPSLRATASAAINASPAPVASMLFTGIFGNQRSPSCHSRRLPCSPACTATAFAPRLMSCSAAVRAELRSSTWTPVIACASDASGLITSTMWSRSSGSGTAGEGSKTILAPASCPRRIAVSATSKGTSSCVRRILVSLIASTALCTSSTVRAWLAPMATSICFCPC